MTGAQGALLKNKVIPVAARPRKHAMSRPWR
jgi:hypothetical protein